MPARHVQTRATRDSVVLIDPLAVPWLMGRLDVTQSWRRELKSRIKLAFVAALAGAAVLLSGSASRADFELKLSDSEGHSLTLIDTGGTGVIQFNGVLGAFNILLNTTAVSYPASGSPDNPNMDVNFVAVKSTGTAADTLTILASDTGFTPVPSGGWNVSFGGTVINPSSNVTYQAFANSSDNVGAPFDTSGNASDLLTVSTGSTGGFSSISTNPLVSAPYSLTQQVIINAGAGFDVESGDATITAAPEPATVAMLFAGIPVLGFGWLGRRMLKLA
jgi:hypothetical protein